VLLIYLVHRERITVLSVIITTGVISTVTIIGEKPTRAITIISVLKCNLHAKFQL
jgi:hypothetical protein